MRLKPNKTFWRGAPKFDELVFKYFKDEDAAVAALRKGEVSFVAGSPAPTPAQAASLKGEPNIKVNDAPGRRFYALATNPGAQAKDGKHFGDGAEVAAEPEGAPGALHGDDRKTLVDKVFQGHAVEGEGYIPPRFSTYHWKPSASQELAYDPAKAAQLLDAAGYKKNADGKRVEKNGKPIDYRILRHATDPNDKAVGQYVKEWFGKLGIGVTLNCLDNVTDPWLAGKYDLAFDGWSVNPDPDFVLSIHTCGALPATAKDTGATDNFICDKKYDELYDQQLAEYDTAKRADLVKQMESRLYDTGYMTSWRTRTRSRPTAPTRSSRSRRCPRPRATSTARTVTGAGGRRFPPTPPVRPPTDRARRASSSASSRASSFSWASGRSSRCDAYATAEDRE